MKTSRQQDSYIESACTHAKIVEAIPTATPTELRDIFKASLVSWKDDMVQLLFSKE
jgi:hypothetical protein